MNYIIRSQLIEQGRTRTNNQIEEKWEKARKSWKNDVVVEYPGTPIQELIDSGDQQKEIASYCAPSQNLHQVVLPTEQEDSKITKQKINLLMNYHSVKIGIATRNICYSRKKYNTIVNDNLFTIFLPSFIEININ